MLAFLRGRVSDRTLRLFACACCRLVWDLVGEVGREVVEVAERFAEGRAPKAELTAARKRAAQARRVLADTLPRAYDNSRDEGEAAFAAVRGLEAATRAASSSAFEAASEASVCTAHGAGTTAARGGAPASYESPEAYVELEMAGRARVYRRQCALLRELVGNPFDAGWPAG
jgi:hypothetical protein